MKILFVVSRPLEINTSASIRNRATIEGLLELGHDVDLITTQFDPKHSNFEGNTIKLKGLNVNYLKLGGVQRVARFGRRVRLLNPAKRIIYNLKSKMEIYDSFKGIINYALSSGIQDGIYDVIISSSDPKSSHLFISKLFERGVIKYTPWIQIWGDPFLSDITRKNNLFNRRIKKEENRLLTHANKIIYVSNLTLKEQKNSYPNHSKKMSYVPIPYVKSETYSLKNKQKDSLKFLYCGDYSSKIREITPLYKALNNSDHSLNICGNSDLKLKNTKSVKVHPRVSFGKTKELEKECDVLVHLSNLKGTQIPGKVYQYSGTNKIILFILDGDKEQLIETFDRYERFVFCENNKEDIERAIIQINDGMYNYTRFVVDDFNPKKIASKILKLDS